MKNYHTSEVSFNNLQYNLAHHPSVSPSEILRALNSQHIQRSTPVKLGKHQIVAKYLTMPTIPNSNSFEAAQNKLRQVLDLHKLKVPVELPIALAHQESKRPQFIFLWKKNATTLHGV